MVAVASMSAQKDALKQAEKLGKEGKLTEARAVLAEAAQNPETKNDPNTYFTAGKIEFDAFGGDFNKIALGMLDPATLDWGEMASRVINGYENFRKAMPLDSLPNEKGQVKPKYAKKMQDIINANIANFNATAGQAYNTNHRYPAAYGAFMILGDVLAEPWVNKDFKAKADADTTAANAYYFSGLGAFTDKVYDKAVIPLKKARKLGFDNMQSYLLEISSWQYLMEQDSTLTPAAYKAIAEVCYDALNRFDMAQPAFFTTLVENYANQEQYDDALQLVNDQIKKHPDMPVTYATRGFVYNRMGKDAESIADYKTAADMNNADVQVLKRAAAKLLNHGAQEWDALKPGDKAGRDAVVNDCWKPAQAYIERALKLDPKDGSLESLQDRVNYALYDLAKLPKE